MAEKKYKIIFFGTPEFAVAPLARLAEHPRLEIVAVVTQTDRPVGRHQELTAPPVKREAVRRGVPVLQPEKIRTPEFEQVVRDLAPDAVIVVAYGKIIPENLLAIPPHGWINVHASLLPKLRGASPIQHAILLGFPETGVSIMRIEPTLDTGPIIAQERMPLDIQETFQTLHDKLMQLGADLLSRVLIPYLKGSIKPVEQDHAGATECRTIRKEEGKIDWQKSALDIERHIRAFNPWPGSFTTFNGAQLKIHKALVLAQLSQTPGTLEWKDTRLIVHTGDDQLELLVLQLEGKKPMSAQGFANGYSTALPTQLT